MVLPAKHQVDLISNAAPVYKHIFDAKPLTQMSTNATEGQTNVHAYVRTDEWKSMPSYYRPGKAKITKHSLSEAPKDMKNLARHKGIVAIAGIQTKKICNRGTIVVSADRSKAALLELRFVLASAYHWALWIGD